MNLFIILGITFPLIIIVIILGTGFDYAHSTSEKINNMYQNIPLEEYTCEYIINRINFIDENRVLGFDSDNILKTLKIKSAKLGCGF